MRLILTLFSTALLFSFPSQVQAVCPVCTIAVGAGVGLSRFLGIDDTISGVWIGGLIFSSGLWLADFLDKRKVKFPYLKFWSIFLFFLFVLPPLYWAKMIGIPANRLWGFDKLLLGIIVGSVLFVLAVWTDKVLRKSNKGKVYIYYQKVILPVLYLTITSFIFYFVSRR